MAAVRRYFSSVRPSFADYFSEVVTETPAGYRPLFQMEHMAQAAVVDYDNPAGWRAVVELFLLEFGQV